MIKVRLGDLVGVYGAFDKIAALANGVNPLTGEEVSESERPVFRLTRNVIKLLPVIGPDVNDYHIQHEKILKKFGTVILEQKKNEAGELVYDADGSVEMVESKMYSINDLPNYTKYEEQLLNIEIELVGERIYPEDIDQLKIFTASDTFALEKFLVGYEEVKDQENVPARKTISIEFDEPEENPQLELFPEA